MLRSQKVFYSPGHCFPVESPILRIDRKLFLFCSEVALCALNKFMRFVPQLQSDSEKVATFAKGTVITVARLDSRIGTILTFFSHDDTDKAGGHLETLCHNTFALFFSKAHNQLIGCIRLLVEVRCAEDSKICIQTIMDTCFLNETSRSFTEEIYISSSKTD